MIGEMLSSFLLLFTSGTLASDVNSILLVSWNVCGAGVLIDSLTCVMFLFSEVPQKPNMPIIHSVQQSIAIRQK